TQHLRTLFPTRLFHPLAPLIDPKRETTSNPSPKSPRELCGRLARSVRDALAEVETYKRDFAGDGMRAVLARTGELQQQQQGQAQQLNPVWTRMYAANLDALASAETAQHRELETHASVERLRQDAAREKARWRDVVAALAPRLEGMEVTVVTPTQTADDQTADAQPMFEVRLVQASLTLRFRWLDAGEGKGKGKGDAEAQAQAQAQAGAGEWHLLDSDGHSDRFTLRTQIIDAVYARERKWDLAYLITLLASYTSTTPQLCAHCNSLLDGHAHLAVARKHIVDENAPGGGRWLPYHPGCL
ncbi:hypothetical protein KEM56_004290, partial [Ascosphaera pollenicola]